MSNYRLLIKLSTAIIVAIFSFSCQPTYTAKIEQIKGNNKTTPQPNITYGEFILKEQSDYLMIPVYFIDRNKERGNYLDSSGYSGRDNQLYNIIFYSKQNDENHLLLNKKGIITSFDLLEVKALNKPSTRVWLYRIIDKDTNEDKKLTKEDAISGYLSDLSGRNLQQITPNNSQVINWVVVPSQNTIFIRIIKDSNNDKKFTEVDKTNFLRINLDKPGMGTEIINEEIEQEIKSYVLK